MKIKSILFGDGIKYAALLLLAVITYTFLSGGQTREQDKTETHHEVPAFRAAEEKAQENMMDEEYWAALLRRKPWMGFAATGASVLFLSILGYGIVIDFVWLTKRIRGKSLVARVAHPPEQVWRVRDLIKVIILIMSMSVASMAVLGVIFYWLPPERSSTGFFSLFHALWVDISVVFCIFYVVRRIGVGRFRSLGLRFKRWRGDIGVGLAGYCAVLPAFLTVLSVLIWAAQRAGYEPPPHPLVEILSEEEGGSSLILGFSILLACIIGPVVEEIFFRGFFYPVLRRRLGKVAAALVSAAAFAGVHHSGFVFVPVFILGLMLVYLYEVRGSLIPSIVLHVAHNSFSLASYFFLKSVFLGG